MENVSAGLIGLGVRRRDRVGIWAPNVPEWLLMQFAIARVGGILVNLNPAYRTDELLHALTKVCDLLCIHIHILNMNEICIILAITDSPYTRIGLL